jgi:hypothetical protein
MDVVGRQEAPVFTWNPVEQMWVQERGGATKPPPAPHDVHAIQTWFLDADENEWIQTVLGPLGRQLAAQWRGAYRVPDTAIVRASKGKKKRSPVPLLVAGVVLIALIGGVAVAAPGLMGSAPPTTANVPQPTGPNGGATTNPVATSAPDPNASPVATADPTVAPSNGPAATPRPATPRPATPAPTPKPATPPPDFVTPSVSPVGTTFHFTFTGLPVGVTYRTTYTRGSVVMGYVNGEVPQNGTVQIDLRTAASSFPPDTYFFTMRAGDIVRTVSFRVT